jgi:DNA-binding transcriptional ArsR family regulator
MPPYAIDDVAAVNHPARRRVVDFLFVNGPATVGMLAAGLGQQVGSVSHHLKVLERAGFVEPAPELARDRRESWWRGVHRRFSWSVSDFEDSAADRLGATAAEQANLQHHVEKVLGWFATREEYDPAWVDAAFSSEQWVNANPEELTDFTRRVQRLFEQWAQECRAAAAEEDPDEGAAHRRTAVFVSVHANPARP